MSLGHCKETLPWGLRETSSIPGACLLSWSLWPSHPTASPWFGWGTGLAIPRKCLPPVQAGIPAYTPLESVCVCVCVCITGRGEMVECFLLSRPGRVLGTTWGPSPHPHRAGEVPSTVPLPRPPSSAWLCGCMNQLSQLVKARPLVFMPSPQETELRLFQLHSAGGQGPHFINIPKPVRTEGTEMV